MTIILQPYDIRCEPSPSISAATLLQSSWLVYVIFFAVSKKKNKKTGYLDDLRVAVLRCNDSKTTKCGYPNYGGGDLNSLPEHPLFEYGLENRSSSILEVINSSWSTEVFEQLKKSSDKDSLFLKPKIEELKHFIIIFDDSTFECIASSLTVEKYCQTFDEAYAYVIDEFGKI